MADAFLQVFRTHLPDEIADELNSRLDQLENGEYQAILEDPLARCLFGHDECAELANIVWKDYTDWSEYIFRRIGLLLSKRQDDDGDKDVTSKPLYRQHLFFIVAVAALQAFVQSNITGPPLAFTSSKLVFPPDVTSNAKEVLKSRELLIKSLGVDGAAVYKLTPNVELLSLADTLLTCPPIQKNVTYANWASLRTSFVHQRLLSETSSTIQSTIYDLIDSVERELTSERVQSATPDQLAQFSLEEAAIHTYHGLDKKAREAVDRAANLRHFEFALTGLPGKRTKYQVQDTSQLVVLAKSKEVSANGANGANGSGDVSHLQSDRSRIQPQIVNLDDDTLLENISFSPESNDSAQVKDESTLPQSLASIDPSNQPKLDPLDSILLLNLASSITKTSPSDGLTREETLPYAERVLDGGSSNWQIYTQALLVRSRIEGYRSRTTERGLLQLQTLVDQVIAETGSNGGDAGKNSAIESKLSTFLPRAEESESAPANERLRYVYQLNTPARWELEAELAARWVSLGGLKSALEIYERLEMWPEAALCWAATEREDKAIKIVRRQIFHSSSGDDEAAISDDTENWEGVPRDPPPADAPRLYCILGDLKGDISMYDRAWQVSNSRYPRAQRSLGRHYFATRQYQQCADAYAKALKINQLNQSSWFALGCALLELSQFDKAAEAFSRTVQLDDTDGEAWSNLAAALLRKGSSVPVESFADSNGTEANSADLDDEGAPIRPRQADPSRNKHDALKALKRAAALKHNDPRIWDNLLTIAASVNPPAYAEIIHAQQRVIELRGPTDGEQCVDTTILEHLVRHAIALSEVQSDGKFDPSLPGLQRLVVELVDKHVVPLITGSTRLWQLVARLALWRQKPGSALEAHEKAWRAATTKPGWESGTEGRWNDVVDATVDLADAYESLGSMERTEGLAAGSGELVAKDWKFKARSAVRGIMGKGKESWEDSEGWKRLEQAMENLKSSR